MGYIGAGVTRFNTADELTVTGDAQIDTTTLVVDSTNNRVGIGTASPATALDVTGTVTADAATLSGTSPVLSYSDTDNSITAQIGSGTSDFNIATTSAHNLDIRTNNTRRMVVESDGDISFYDSTGVTQGLFWDASRQELGIGTTSTSKTLTVHGNDGVPLQLQGSGNDTAIAFAHSGTINSAINSSSDGAIEFRIGGISSSNEAVRIDSSQNLLVGTTSQTPGGIANDPGVALSSGTYGGLISATRDGGAVCDFNRKTSDGGIVQFRKDGTIVGSIGNRSTALQVQSDGGVGVDLALNNIFPLKSGSLTDDAVTLGDGTRRFKDLYLSGGAYIGGTAAANQLDDYEEGSWTPTMGGDGGDPTTTYNAQSGRYVKIGKLVYVWCRITVNTISGGSGSAVVRGLPFTSENVDAQRGNSAVMLDSLTTDARETTIQVDLNATSLTLIRDSGKTGSHAGLGINLFQSGTDVRFQYAYREA